MLPDGTIKAFLTLNLLILTGSETCSVMRNQHFTPPPPPLFSPHLTGFSLKWLKLHLCVDYILLYTHCCMTLLIVCHLVSVFLTEKWNSSRYCKETTILQNCYNVNEIKLVLMEDIREQTCYMCRSSAVLYNSPAEFRLGFLRWTMLPF